MNRYLSLVLLVGMAATSAAGEDAVFHKSRIFDSHGKAHEVDLVFLGESKTIVVREKISVLTHIPFDTIDKVASGYSTHHRVKEGAEVMTGGGLLWPVGVVFGPALMSTKSKDHWLYVDYKDVGGAKQLVLKLDKSEYQRVIATTKARTGRDVEILPKEGKEKK